MKPSAYHFITVFLVSIIVSAVAFVLSLLGIFNLVIIGQIVNAVLIIALVLYAVFIHVFTSAEKSRLLREALCSCGKLVLIGFVGTILSALMTNLLYGGTIRILLDLSIGLMFFFLTLILSGIGCIITTLAQCRRNDC